jgi:monoamine oxidase
MSRAGIRTLSSLEYLPPDQRELRAKRKREEAVLMGLTPDWFRQRKDRRLPPGLRVGVVGGGLAGLSAAWYLNELGVATTVFEAAESTGGRVKSDALFVPKKVIELGAELIGENHPLWGLLRLRFNLSLVPLTDDEDYEAAGLNVRMRFGSADLSKSEKQALAKRLTKHCTVIGAEAKSIHETAPWKSKGADAFDKISVAARLAELCKQDDLARLWFTFTLANDNCAEVSKQSYLGLLASVSAARMGSDSPGMLGYWYSTETHRCDGGNDLLAFMLGGKLPDLRLRSSANHIGIDPYPDVRRPVRIDSTVHDSGGNPIQQRADEYDFAVLSVPPTTWGSITVSPPFDPRGWAIQHGNAVKFFSRYDTEFWKAAKLAPSAKWDQLGSVWEGTDNQGDKPEFDLTVFSGGPHVRPAKDYPVSLSTLYPTGNPTAQRFVDWSTVPFIKTGYAVPGVGEVMRICRNQIVPHAERLFFAGEQTSSGFFGYMEGALQSGARAARDIVISASLPV